MPSALIKYEEMPKAKTCNAFKFHRSSRTDTEVVMRSQIIRLGGKQRCWPEKRKTNFQVN